VHDFEVAFGVGGIFLVDAFLIDPDAWASLVLGEANGAVEYVWWAGDGS
jgi:hypothetical protein